MKDILDIHQAQQSCNALQVYNAERVHVTIAVDLVQAWIDCVDNQSHISRTTSTDRHSPAYTNYCTRSLRNTINNCSSSDSWARQQKSSQAAQCQPTFYSSPRLWTFDLLRPKSQPGSLKTIVTVCRKFGDKLFSFLFGWSRAKCIR